MCAPAPNQRYLQHSFNSVELIPDRDDYGDGDGYTTTTLMASATMMATTSNLYLRECAVRFNSYDRLCRVPLTLIIMTVLFARF